MRSIASGKPRSTFIVESLELRQLLSAVMPSDGYGYSPPPPPPPPPADPASTTESASASVVATQLSTGNFQYSITLKNTAAGRATATNQIETFWFAWTPDNDFLDTAPISVSSPSGWTDTVTHSGSADGFAIQWTTSSNALEAHKSLSGFSFTSADTPAQVFGNSNFFPSTPVTTAVVYSGAPFSDAGFDFKAAGSISNPSGALLPELAGVTPVNGNTVPATGDENPYGVAFVPKGFPSGGATASGDVLVSNFNNNNNLQGTGTTIMSVTPAGNPSVFYQGPTGEGLTTALGVLRAGFVIVGNVPSTDGTAATVKQGSLIVLDRSGNQVAAFTDPTLLDGPWDLALVDNGATAKLFVSNVLTGTVTRLDLKVSAKTDTVSIVNKTQIASGFAHGRNSTAFELGPTGLAYNPANNTLYVASTQDNAVFAINDAAGRTTDAGTGTMIYQDNAHLRGPLGLVITPNGDLIASNGDAVNPDPTQPSELVEFTPKGQFVAETPVDSSGEGGAFGIAISAPQGNTIQFAAVDDISNSLDIWTLQRNLLRKR